MLDAVDLSLQLSGPSAAHWLGTDNLGRDLLSRLTGAVIGTVLPLWGATISAMLVGWAVSYGTILGAAQSAFFARILQVLNVSVAGISALPMTLAIFLIAIYFEVGLPGLVLGFACMFSLQGFRTIQVLHLTSQSLGYWTAHESLGGSLSERLWRYGIAGSWRTTMLAALARGLRTALILEATLSYLGFGVQEPNASFGNMIAAHFNLFFRGRSLVPWWIIGSFVLVSFIPEAALALYQRHHKRKPAHDQNTTPDRSHEGQPALQAHAKSV